MNAGYGVLSESAVGQEFGYTGRRHDVEGTGLMYFRARYYSGELGRFVSRDPLGTALDVGYFDRQINEIVFTQILFNFPGLNIYDFLNIFAKKIGVETRVNVSQYHEGLNIYQNYFVIEGVDPSGMTSYTSIQAAFQRALASGSIRELQMMLGTMGLSPCTRDAIRNAMTRANRIIHIFNNPRHVNVRDLARIYDGNKEAAFKALEKAFSEVAKNYSPQELAKGIQIVVDGIPITVRGAVVDGVVKVGTAF
jgi:RHS repeat-associated protein